MKNLLVKIATILFLQCCTFALSAHVILDSPQGGEYYTGNTIVTITWHIAVPHNQLNWDLLFSPDGGNSWEPIQLDLPVNQTSYTWVVPNNTTAFARISIIQDNSEQDYKDESLNFTILPGSTAPFIDLLAQDATFTCDNYLTLNINNWLESHGGATVIGECGDIEWTHDYTGLGNGCSNYTGSAYVTFTATDDCGSTSTGAYLTAIDTVGPNLLNAASDLVLPCGPNNNAAIEDWLLHRGGMVIFEVCSNVQWSNNYSSLSNECGESGITVVTFSATDDCGNITSTTARLTIEDTSGPQITSPAKTMTISCSTPNPEEHLQNWLQNAGGAAASDNCGNVSWTNNFTALTDDCGMTQRATVTFTATDECGNETHSIAEFKITDTIAPLITKDARDTTIQCESADAVTSIGQWLANHGGAAANDNCDTVIWTHDFPVLADSCDLTRKVLVTFTYSDGCNNYDTTQASITILSTTGTSEDGENIHYTLSPNPVDDILRFESKDALPVRVYIYDTRGRLLHSQKENESVFHINVEVFEAGMYLFQLVSPLGISVHKVLVQ